MQKWCKRENFDKKSRDANKCKYIVNFQIAHLNLESTNKVSSINRIFYSFTFQAMHSTESQIVERHITSTDKLKAPSEHFKVPTMYWLPKLPKKPFRLRFISASSKCATTKLSIQQLYGKIKFAWKK